MRTLLYPLRFIALLALILIVTPAYPVDAPVLVSDDVLNARLKEVEASTSLDEETRASLTELLNRALGNLGTVRVNKETTNTYIQARKTAPEQGAEIREKLEGDKEAATEVRVDAKETSPFEEIEQELLQEKANLAAVQAKLDDIETLLESTRERPAVIQSRLVKAKQDRETIEADLKSPSPADENAWVTEARRWSQTTRVAELRSEIAMLDQELLSMPMRIKLMEAKRDRLVYTIEKIKVRIKLLSKYSSRQGRAEAEQAEAEAEAAVYDAAGKHPLIQALAEQNAELTKDISTMAAALKKVSVGSEAINRDAKRIEDNFRNARVKLEVAGLSEVLGQVLRKQRQTLPEQRNLKKRIKRYEQDNAHVSLSQIQHNEEYRKLRHIDSYIAEHTADLDASEAGPLDDDLRELAEHRRLLLGKALDINKSYRRSLNELTASYRQLLDATVAFDGFLAEKLLWIRSAPAPNMAAVLAIPGQVALLFSPERWLEVSRALVSGLVTIPVVGLLFIAFGMLMWKTRHFKVLLRALSMQVGKPSLDKFSFTLKALGLTVLLAAPWPLLVATLGFVIGSGADESQFPLLVSSTLIKVATTFFYLQFFSVLCLPDGVAGKHFHWPDPLPQELSREFYFLKIAFLPAMFFALLVFFDNQRGVTGGLERLIMVFALTVVALFSYRLINILVRSSIGSIARLRYLWLTLTVLVPFLLAVIAFIGYFFTAGVLAGSLVETLWFIFGLVVLHQVVVRWLLLTQRRLALEAVRERMRAAREDKAPVDSEMEGLPVHVDEPEIDLVAMSDESRKLLNTMLVIIGVVGFWLIWSEVLPAFNILDEVTLWHKTAIVAGEETLVPVTLANISVAILIAFATVVAMKRFPALLEIVLLQRVKVKADMRYTITTLTTYVIVGVGLVAFFNVIGADWSKVQWLFAALSVGIGFGLQEIVANFISGIIILFERPIRVGDVVTIGTTDGVVTRIQIRATTIRTWDRQELLVPNKEFITGRLLNWSLSDQTTRLKVPVGVAYGSDVEKAMSLMAGAAAENEHVLAEPKPSIIFEAFGDNTLNLVLRCFVGNQDIRMTTLTQLHEAINRKFNEAGITIAFPQRDVHLDTLKPLDVRITRDEGPSLQT